MSSRAITYGPFGQQRLARQPADFREGMANAINVVREVGILALHTSHLLTPHSFPTDRICRGYQSLNFPGDNKYNIEILFRLEKIGRVWTQ